MGVEFGQYPLFVYLDGDHYAVSPEHAANADECGIPETFTSDRFDIMKARGEAHGYALSIVPKG